MLACTLLIAACGGDEAGGDPGAGNPTSNATDYAKALADAPAPLADLYANGDAIIEGGADEFESQLAALEGYPVVVNTWASWCGPCRLEFPIFQAVAADRGDADRLPRRRTPTTATDAARDLPRGAAAPVSEHQRPRR